MTPRRTPSAVGLALARPLSLALIALCAAAALSPVLGQDAVPPAEPPARATAGMVSSAHPMATQAGLEILAGGGNAFDAAVAAALNVVEPMMSGAGGYGTILVYSARDHTTLFLNASGRIPRGVRPEEFREPAPGYLENRRGAKAVSTPGNVNAWAAMHGRFGSLEWSRLFAPAVRLARDGFVLDERFARELASAYEEFPDQARVIYGREGGSLGAGDRLIQADLGRSLELIAREGAGAFYRGELAEAIDHAMRDADGFLRLQDLRDNEAEWWAPIGAAARLVPCRSATTVAAGRVTACASFAAGCAGGRRSCGTMVEPVVRRLRREQSVPAGCLYGLSGGG